MPKVAGDAVHVEGMAELRRALKGIDPKLPKALRAKLVPIATRVAGRVRGSMPRRSGRAASSVGSGVSGNTAYVSLGKASVPYAGWLDFGGTLHPTGGRHGTQTRPLIPGGRYLFPAITANAPDTERAAQAAFEQMARELGLK